MNGRVISALRVLPFAPFAGGESTGVHRFCHRDPECRPSVAWRIHAAFRQRGRDRQVDASSDGFIAKLVREPAAQRNAPSRRQPNIFRRVVMMPAGWRFLVAEGYEDVWEALDLLATQASAARPFLRAQPDGTQDGRRFTRSHPTAASV
jgi:hypothetical protein